MGHISLGHFLVALRSRFSPSPLNNQQDKSALVRIALYCFIACLIISLALLSHYYLSVSNDQRYALHKEKMTVELIEQTLAENLNNMAADAKNFAFISHSLITLPKGNQTQLLQQYFLQFIKNQSHYSQIRLLDNKGQEQVRVNHNKTHYEVVPESQLQDKSQRYYFQKSRQLAPGQVYISPLDQNMEEGKPQLPITPTIRVSAPVYDQGKLAGVIVLNYRALPLIKQLLRLSPYFLNRLYIINDEGVAQIQPLNDQAFHNPGSQKQAKDQEAALRFMDINGQQNAFTFTTSHTIPQNIKYLLDSQESGRLVNRDAYLTFATRIAPDNQRWHIVSSFSKLYFAQISAQFFNQYLIFYLLLYGFAILASLYVAITQTRSRNQAKQKAYEQQFRQVLEEIQLLAVSLNQQGQVVFCNDFFLQRVGYEKADVIGKDWIERFIPSELRQQVEVSLGHALQQGQNQTIFKDVIQDKNGQIHLISWTSTFLRHHPPLSSTGEEQLGVLTFVGEDITRQEQTQDQLKQLNHAVEQSQNSVIITDLDGHIIYVNPHFCQVTGYQEQEVLGRSPKFLQSGEMKSLDYADLWSALIAGKEWRGELHNKKKDGSFFWERAVISPVKDVAGKNLYYVSVKQDISQEKHLTQALESETEQRLQHEKLAAIGKVVSMIAHDLRNPLSSIKMVLQMYQRKNQDELCQISLQQVRYMEAILEDLLTYSKPEQRQAQWLDFNKLVQQTCMAQERLANAHSVKIELQLDDKLPTLYADPIKLKQALQNILVNGIQACQTADNNKQAKVRIRSQLLLLNKPLSEISRTNSELVFTNKNHQPSGDHKKPYLFVEIFNTGTAIDSNIIEQVFEPFFTTKASGTGLGLAIVKRIIELHHGFIHISPTSKQQNEQGTRVCIALPTSSNHELDSQNSVTTRQESHEQITHL